MGVRPHSKLKKNKKLFMYFEAFIQNKVHFLKTLTGDGPTMS